MDFKHIIVLDAFGGDNAPNAIIDGTINAVKSNADLKCILCGDKEIIDARTKDLDYNREQIEIVDCKQIISNDESPTVAIKTKTDSSLVKAFDALRTRDDVDALISAGSTGAVLTGGFLKVGRMTGVSRPALAPLLPTKIGTNVCLIDCGANMDCKPINLAHFAIMGSAYMQSIGINNPRVALLNVGVEDKKGNDLTKECHEIFKKLPINYVGNMEARDFLSGDYDVVVTDGFSGNVLLKGTEGAAIMVQTILKKEIKSHFTSILGALLMKKVFKSIKNTLSHENKGGSPFLGAKKIIIKSHGSSNAETIVSCINQAINLKTSGLYEDIKNKIENIDFEGIIDEENII